MKYRVLNILAKVLTVIAVVCATSPSRYNCYEPDKPDSLK